FINMHMQISELNGKVPKEVIDAAKARGITSLTPPQVLAIESGLLDGKNIVISAPTASGKTFAAEMAMIKTVLWRFKKAIYVAPMRAIVSEKYEEFKSSYPFLKVAISIGDMDSLDPWLEKYDITFVSVEKLDSLIRHGLDWLDSIGCVIFDEVHMLDDVERGPTLEVLMTKLKRVCRNAQIIALSATIGNANEIASWLGAKLVESDYRPVPLYKGVEFGGIVYYANKKEKLKSDSSLAEARIAEDTFGRGKQLLAFYATRRYAEAGAERLSEISERYLSEDDKARLREVSETVLHALSRPTLQCERLARLILKGAAFHHSGLVNEQRHVVETAFKENLIKVISATTTLGYGVNLPANTVVIKNTSRYRDDSGSAAISVNEVQQLFGRAGRPSYDEYGRAMLIARSKNEIKTLFKKYIDADLDPINSKLGVLSVLRTHVLAFIATKFARSEESILNFLSETFYGYQYSNMSEIGRIVGEIISELAEWSFIERKGGIYEATRIGSRVSELYIDPLSAKWMIDTMPKVRDDISGLFMISNTIEMRPYVRVTAEAEEAFPEYESMVEHNNVYAYRDYSYYDPLKPFSTALMLDSWINEKSEQEITSAFATTPGALFAKISNADWLLYSAMELAKLLHMSYSNILELRVRTRYGIKKELMDLVRLEQVGRVRARILYSNGIRSIADLRMSGAEAKVKSLLGAELAKKIMDQLENF
ncbi:MAG: DEAD/DEAH box helicase, partial [Candidatus Micrarchaeaceae archaeon]